jgi:hypothetical protein
MLRTVKVSQSQSNRCGWLSCCKNLCKYFTINYFQLKPGQTRSNSVKVNQTDSRDVQVPKSVENRLTFRKICA